jgi:glycosyltransferase involved in cell wall biosynthesis
MFKASICIATYNKPKSLEKTLESIFKQDTPYKYEVIVVDDNSPEDETHKICCRYPVQYIKLLEEHKYRNPAIARNVAYKKAKGEIIIAQSDDVIHVTSQTITMLIEGLRIGSFVIATVYNMDENGKCIRIGSSCQLTGLNRKRPLFFLGALYRKDLYAIGGNDEEFIYPGREDVYFGECLVKGLGLQPFYAIHIIGHHQHHPRNLDTKELQIVKNLYRVKVREGKWCSSGGPWKYAI